MKVRKFLNSGAVPSPMEETRQRILDRLNNNTFYWIDTDGSLKKDYLTDEAELEDYAQKSGAVTPLNWEFNLITPTRFGLGAIGNGIKTGLRAMNTAFTPSTWLNPVTGAKLLSPTLGTVADAGIQGAFAYEGLNGLWNQGRQGTLLSDPASTLMHGLEVLPMVGAGTNAVRNIANQSKAADIANTQAVVKPFNSEDLFYQNLFNYSKNLYSRYGRFLGNYYKNKINTITDPVLRHIAEISPQYIDEVLEQQAKGGATEDFVKGLIQRANNYRRYVDKPLSAEDFATFRGGYTSAKGNGTIHVEGAQRSMDYGNYPAYYQGQPKLEGPMETWWDQRIPQGVNVRVGMHSRINPVIQKHISRLRHSANLNPDYESYVFGNNDLYSVFWDAFRSTGAPEKTILWPVHQVFEGSYGTRLPNFNITVGEIPSGFSWGKGYKYGGSLVRMPIEGDITTSDVPAITAENAASITPALWDVAYNKAVVSNNNAEVLRLRDLHFYAKTGETPTIQYRGSSNPTLRNTYYRNDGSAVWFTPDEDAASFYTPPGTNRPPRAHYIKTKDGKILHVDGTTKNFDGSTIPSNWSSIPVENIPENISKHFPEEEINFGKIRFKSKPSYVNTGDIVHAAKLEGYNQVDFQNIIDAKAKSSGVYPQFTTRYYNNIKLADPITYDDAGNIIPLSKRDNFNSSDIRYGILPWIFGGTIGYNYLNQDETSSKYTNGGKLTKHKL